jgi:ketosteroid isomerase-like protein
MRQFALLPLLAVILVGSVDAQEAKGKSATTEEIRKQVLLVENEVEEALSKNDVDTLNRIYPDTYAYINASGELLSKAQFLSDLRSGKHKILAVEHEDVQLQIYGDTVVVMTGVSASSFKYKGQVTNGPRRFTNVFVKQDGQWILVAHQVTDIAKH